MLSKVQVYNALGDYLYLKIEGSDIPGSFVVEKIDGIGQVKASVAYSNYARLPGGVYHSSRHEVRNIVIRVGFNPNFGNSETIKSMRDRLNRVIRTGEFVRLRLHRDDTYREVTGRVESSEPEFFSDDPAMVISILCIDPYFKAPEEVTLLGTTGVTNAIEYDGDVNTGVRVEVVAASDLQTLRIEDRITGDIARVRHSIPAGQRIRIDTRGGHKGAWRVSGEGEIIKKLIGSLEIEKNWPQIRPLSNSIAIYQDGTPSSNFRMTYPVLYGSGD